MTRNSRCKTRQGHQVTQGPGCGATRQAGRGALSDAESVRAHPHSVASRCFGVWSPAPPPSARTGSGLSGTARTLRRRDTVEQAARCPRGSGRQPVGAPAAPGLTLQHLPLTHGAGSSPTATSSAAMRPVSSRPARTPRGRPRRRLSLRREPFLSVYPRLPGNRPEPERYRLAATARPGRDVTAGVPGAGRRQPAPGELRLQGAPGTCHTRQAAAGIVHRRCHDPAALTGCPPGVCGSLQTEPAPAKFPD